MWTKQQIKDAVAAFFANQQVQVFIKGAFASSGVAYSLLEHRGLSPEQIGLAQTLVTNFGPMAVVGAWELMQRTHAAIVSKAAEILAAKQAGSITVNVQTAPASLAALATSSGSPTNVIAQTGDDVRDAIAVVSAMPDIKQIVTTDNAGDGVSAMVADAAQPKVVPESAVKQ